MIHGPSNVKFIIQCKQSPKLRICFSHNHTTVPSLTFEINVFKPFLHKKFLQSYSFLPCNIGNLRIVLFLYSNYTG